MEDIMLKNVLLTTTMLATTASFACTVDGTKGIVEDNNLWIGTNAKSVSTIDEAQFNASIDKVMKIYEPIIAAEGKTLEVNRNWDDGTVNAYASQTGDTWFIHMFGGLARHETITSDGFELVVCHEIGHHIGGAPKKTSWTGTPRWATNEGQADYWATLKCLRKSWRGEDHTAMLATMTVPEVVVNNCNAQFSDVEDRLICQRGAMAGLSTAKLFQALRRQSTAPDFETPDSNEVSRHNHNHPATQCRLDTYYNGALCGLSEMVDVDQEDVMAGSCNRADGESLGNRPLCWFKPETL